MSTSASRGLLGSLDSGRIFLTAVVLGSFLVRLAFVASAHPLGEHLSSDMWVYDLRAKHLLSGELGPWDSFTPAGYPLFVASFYATMAQPLPAIGFAQAILGALTVLLTHRLARALSQPQAVAFFAAIVVAFHVPAILYVGLLLSETLFSFVLLLASLTLVRSIALRSWPWAIAGGLALGIASVVRPNLLLVYPLVPVFAFLGLERLPRRTVVYSILILLPALVPVAFHSAHHSRLVDRWVPTSTNGGLNFYLNLAEVRTVQFREGSMTHQITPVPNLIRYTEVERVDRPFHDDRYFYRRGLHLLRENPVRVTKGLWSLKEFIGVGHQDYWPGWPPWRTLLRVESKLFAWLIVVPALFVLVWMLTRRETFSPQNAGWVWVAGLVGGNLVAGMVFLGDPRLRVPYDPLYAIAAGVAYWQLYRLASSRFEGGRHD